MPSLNLEQGYSNVMHLIPKATRLNEESQVYCYEFTSHDLEKFEFNSQAIIPLSPIIRPPEISEVYCYEFSIIEDTSQAVEACQ